MRNKYNQKWTRPDSEFLARSLFEKASEYQEKFNVADKANLSLQNQIQENMHLFENLSMTKEELEQSIPSSTPATTLALKDPNLKQLKLLLKSLGENLKRRPALIEEYRKIAAGDDIESALMQAASLSDNLDETALFDKQMAIYSACTQELNALIAEQQNILDSITVPRVYSENEPFFYAIKRNK